MSTLAIIAIVAAVVIVVSIALLIRRGRNKLKQQAAASKAAEAHAESDPLVPQYVSNPEKIQLGNALDYVDTSYIVRGMARITEDGYSWVEYYLASSGGHAWLCVEREDDLRVTLWKEQPEHDLVPAKDVVFNGVHYKQLEHGKASFNSAGTTNLMANSGQVEYVDYKSATGQLLSLERYDGQSWELSTGEEVNLNMLQVYP